MVKDLKKEIRHLLRESRDTLEVSLRQENSMKIVERVLESSAYCQAKRVFSFVSIGSEVNTLPILQQAFLDGKKVAVPVTKGNRLMYFIDIQDLSDLHPKKMGLLEPLGNIKEAQIPIASDLFLVPGLAFDEKCGRLGFGGGYYDTYFSNHKEVFKIALAFEMQIVNTPLPMADYDFAVDAVITEKRWIDQLSKVKS